MQETVRGKGFKIGVFRIVGLNEVEKGMTLLVHIGF
jgi:hypothetical protein